MPTRRQFLKLGIGAFTALALRTSDMPIRMLAAASRGGSAVAAPGWQIDGAAASESSLAAVFSANAFTVTEGGETVETGYRPANGSIYNALWTRDHAAALWHRPELLTAEQRRQFVTHRLAKRSTGSEPDPDGGTIPPNFIPDRITSNGTVVYKNAGDSELPFMDGIAFVVLALWSDWNLTGDTATFTANQAAIDACLAALPRSANGCVYSDPAAPSVDWGATDWVTKTGDCAYGTALLAWAYKMLHEVSGEAPGGTYDLARADAEAGLATLRQSDGWYAATSISDSTKDDVWATALIVAEGLVSGADRTASAQTLADAYSAGTITQGGWIRHLPAGQFWTTSQAPQGEYQNGAFWFWPLWDCVRAVAVVDRSLARAWAAEALGTVADHITTYGASMAPLEWYNGATVSVPKGYTTHAALVHRFV